MIIQENEDATYGAGVAEIQAATGATAATAYRWKKNPASMPEAGKRLCRFAVWGDLAQVFGSDWQGFRLAGGKLYPPFFRGGFTPAEISSLFFKVQEVAALRRDLSRAQDALKREQERAAKLRALLVCDSRQYIF